MPHNAFYERGNLDRVYLRTSAVYRCLMRYGVSVEWAVEKCSDVLRKAEARALVEGWTSSQRYQSLSNARWRGEGDGRDEVQAGQ